MKKYNIYFEIYGKKLKTTVNANDPQEAMNLVKNKIIFHKIEEEKRTDVDDFVDTIKSVFKEVDLTCEMQNSMHQK